MRALQVPNFLDGAAQELPTFALLGLVIVSAAWGFAKKEGIFLDPVYTGKGAAGLVGLARDGTLKPGSKVLFLHTGGAPSLFHYQPLLETA